MEREHLAAAPRANIALMEKPIKPTLFSARLATLERIKTRQNSRVMPVKVARRERTTLHWLVRVCPSAAIVQKGPTKTRWGKGGAKSVFRESTAMLRKVLPVIVNPVQGASFLLLFRLPLIWTARTAVPVGTRTVLVLRGACYALAQRYLYLPQPAARFALPLVVKGVIRTAVERV